MIPSNVTRLQIPVWQRPIFAELLLLCLHWSFASGSRLTEETASIKAASERALLSDQFPLLVRPRDLTHHS